MPIGVVLLQWYIVSGGNERDMFSQNIPFRSTKLFKEHLRSLSSSISAESPFNGLLNAGKPFPTLPSHTANNGHS